jgi:hypothetical protein
VTTETKRVRGTHQKHRWRVSQDIERKGVSKGRLGRADEGSQDTERKRAMRGEEQVRTLNECEQARVLINRSMQRDSQDKQAYVARGKNHKTEERDRLRGYQVVLLHHNTSGTPHCGACMGNYGGWRG